MAIPPHITVYEDKKITYYNCTICKKTFKSRDHCRYHRYCHSAASKPFTCSTCDQKFSKKSHLDYHELSHTGELPFKCARCGKGFRTNQKLKRHMISHSGEKLVSCYICDKQLSSSDVLRVHLRTHSEVRPFKCDQCDAAFREKASLDKHLASHSGEKNWICEICGKKCALKWNLILHKRIHAGTRPYACDICDRDFTSHSHLKRHRIIHSEYSEEFVCKICDKGFTRKDNLSRHVKNSHFEDEDPNSETVNNCIKESKIQVSRKVESNCKETQEIVGRTSVIKSVASVIGNIEANSPKTVFNESTSFSQNQSDSANSWKINIQTPVMTDGQKEPISSMNSERNVSVINRAASSSKNKSEKHLGYKILPSYGQTLKLKGSNLTVDESNNSVVKGLKAEKVKNSIVTASSPGGPFSQFSNCNSENKSVESSCKPKTKLEPFRIINQTSLALNLSAKKANYCIKKCLIDARRGFSVSKNVEPPSENSDFGSQALENAPTLQENTSENRNEFHKGSEDYLEYLDLNTSSIKVVSRIQTDTSLAYLSDDKMCQHFYPINGESEDLSCTASTKKIFNQTTSSFDVLNGTKSSPDAIASMPDSFNFPQLKVGTKNPLDDSRSHQGHNNSLLSAVIQQSSVIMSPPRPTEAVNNQQLGLVPCNVHEQESFSKVS